ncbi:hypothetical protein MKZ38_004017 [Zalerion maritima]|uniref:Uncharacterized protein n=1 Tax=Zalerion maritima TaxID=339359 RepID=A0AAD5RM30_9PEZI|nr:hypothetical protein MKZ38_004017 [Zalerion maritima]
MTSAKLCHSGAIVRASGRPKILEAVLDHAADDLPDDGDGQAQPKYGVYSFHSRVHQNGIGRGGRMEGT